MDTLVTPAAVASIVARYLAAPLGVLFLGWSGTDLLVLYYVDTVLALAVLFVLVARHVTGIGPAGGRTRPIAGPLDWVRVSAAALFAAALIGVPLGIPILITFAYFGGDWSMLANRAFLIALAVQAAASFHGALQAHEALLARTDDERVLKRRGAFIFARWLVVVVAATILPLPLLGRWLGGAVLIAIYAGGSVYFELFPDRALRWLNPKGAAEDAREDAEARARRKP